MAVMPRLFAGVGGLPLGSDPSKLTAAGTVMGKRARKMRGRDLHRAVTKQRDPLNVFSAVIKCKRASRFYPTGPLCVGYFDTALLSASNLRPGGLTGKG